MAARRSERPPEGPAATSLGPVARVGRAGRPQSVDARPRGQLLRRIGIEVAAWTNAHALSTSCQDPGGGVVVSNETTDLDVETILLEDLERPGATNV